MSDARADTFAAFVEVLADALDDHDASGDDLAARVHLSRFHLDRVIAAVAGEPPAALRRRVLLERAAYRLTTSDRTVLDVAIEAGYSSNEAFTRAFARAYGSTPAAWRRRPTKVRLDAPNDVHFHPPGWLRLPARTKVGDVDLICRMLEHHVWTAGEMIERAGALTDEQLDAPIEISVEGIDDDPTMRSLLSRLVGQMAMWNASMDGHPIRVVARTSTSRPTRCGGGSPTRAPAFLSRMTEIAEDGRLDETFVDATCEPAADVHLRRDGGPRAHVRGAPTNARGGRSRRRRHHRSGRRRPDALDRRAHLSRARAVRRRKAPPPDELRAPRLRRCRAGRTPASRSRPRPAPSRSARRRR